MHAGSLLILQHRKCAPGYEIGMMITGYIQQRDGLKGGRGVISSNHNKGRALGPSRLGELKRATVWKIKSLSLVDPNSVTDPSQFAFLACVTQKYGFMEPFTHEGGPNLAMDACLRYYPIIKNKTKIIIIIFSCLTTIIKGGK